MKRILKYLIILVALGITVLFAIKIPALGLDTPEFCAACHVMEPQYESYNHSAHRLASTCGDCHLPHSLGYGAVEKAYTGMKDFAGVVRNKDPFEIHASNHAKGIIQANCIRCHGSIMENIGDTSADDGRNCFDCHRNTPHGTYPNELNSVQDFPVAQELAVTDNASDAFMEAVGTQDQRMQEGEGSL